MVTHYVRNTENPLGNWVGFNDLCIPHIFSYGLKRIGISQGFIISTKLLYHGTISNY